MGICFTVFSDFHYKTQMPFAVRYMNEIMDHARTSGAEFVLQCGDFASDWSNSEEILDACLQNKYALPVYGTYGNHDTQVEADQFAFVTPRLTNDENVMWATANGKVNDGEITYYYADRGA